MIVLCLLLGPVIGLAGCDLSPQPSYHKNSAVTPSGAAAATDGDEAVLELINGTPSGSSNIGMLIIAFGNDDYGSCTAEVIAPDVIVTAGHCVTDPTTGKALGPKNFGFTLDAVVSGSTTTYIGVTAVVRHPGFNADPSASDSPNGLDVAVLRLAAGVSVPPLAIATDALTAGQSVTATGYGLAADGSSGSRTSGPFTFTGVFPTATYAIPDGAYDEFASGAGSDKFCFGDSGGPVVGPSQAITALIIGGNPTSPTAPVSESPGYCEAAIDYGISMAYVGAWVKSTAAALAGNAGAQPIAASLPPQPSRKTVHVPQRPKPVRKIIRRRR